ncbi:MAG TPA: transcription antitermination factor NusB [Ruminococcaceae bacterium]|nr:transcription antitermination factor NusB [Oscillospiraceae bacterium]
MASGVGNNMTRKQAREEAFILIFEKQFSADSLQDILEIAVEVRDIVPDEYIKTVFFGAYDSIEEIDAIISDNAIGWSIKRISKTALAILRLAVFEMKYMEDIPVAVSINEAVELSKKYATKDDASFVNGILSTVSKQLKTDE